MTPNCAATPSLATKLPSGAVQRPGHRHALVTKVLKKSDISTISHWRRGKTCGTPLQCMSIVLITLAVEIASTGEGGRELRGRQAHCRVLARLHRPAQHPSAKPAAFHAHPALLLHNTGKNREEIITEKASKTGQLASFHLEDE